METTELVSNDQEHAKGLLGVLDLWQELGSESEGKSDFRGLVEVGLEDVLVENEESFENLKFMLVSGSLTNLIVELLVRKDLLGLETLVRKRRHELSFICLRVVNHGEVHVEQVDQVGVSMNNLSDTFTSESLLPESPLDIIENFCV